MMKVQLLFKGQLELIMMSVLDFYLLQVIQSSMNLLLLAWSAKNNVFQNIFLTTNYCHLFHLHNYPRAVLTFNWKMTTLRMEDFDRMLDIIPLLF